MSVTIAVVTCVVLDVVVNVPRLIARTGVAGGVEPAAKIASTDQVDADSPNAYLSRTRAMIRYAREPAGVDTFTVEVLVHRYIPPSPAAMTHRPSATSTDRFAPAPRYVTRR